MSEEVYIQLPSLLKDCPTWWKNFGKRVFDYPDTEDEIALADINKELSVYNAEFIEEDGEWLKFSNESSFMWFKLKYDHE